MSFSQNVTWGNIKSHKVADSLDYLVTEKNQRVLFEENTLLGILSYIIKKCTETV